MISHVRRACSCLAYIMQWIQSPRVAVCARSTIMVAPRSEAAPYDVAAELWRFAQTAARSSVADVRAKARLCEVCKHVMEMEVRQLVVDAGNRPMLMHYSADGTPLSTKVRTQRQVSENLTVMREGRSQSELLVQHANFRTIDHAGNAVTRVMLRDPLPLAHGKGAWAIFACGAEWATSLRQRGHRGIAVQHYCFDRAGYSASQRMFRPHQVVVAPPLQRHRAQEGLAHCHRELAELVRAIVGVHRELAGSSLTART